MRKGDFQMKKWTTLTMTTALALSLAACSNDDNKKQDTTNETNTTEENTNQTSSTSKETVNNLRAVTDMPVSVEDALKTFNEQFEGVKIASIELDESNGTFVYEIEGFNDTTKYSGEVDENNQLIKQEQEPVDLNDDDNVELQLADYVKVEEAITTASKVTEVENSTPTSWSLNTDFNQDAVYKVDFEDANQEEFQVIIDAKTGKQIEILRD